MERNKELIERTMRHIVDHPERHEQSAWIGTTTCGTVACFAGWALMLDGITAQHLLDWPYDEYGSRFSRVREEAAKRLGLTLDEAKQLFHGCNTRDMLQLMVKDLLNGEELRATDQYKDEARG